MQDRSTLDTAPLYPQTLSATAAARSPRRWRPILASMAAGGIVGAALASAGVLVGRELAAPGWFLAGLLLGLWPNVVLHEAGHLLAGMAAGMRPLALGIGPFRYERTLAGWRAYRGGRLQGASGFASLLPDGDAGAGRGAQVLMLAGGPLANLLVAAACFIAARTFDVTAGAAAFMWGVGGIALVLGVANLVPFTLAAGWRSDGRNLLDLLRRAPDADLHLALQRIIGLSLAGQRPRDWSATALPAATPDLPPTTLATSGHLLCLSRAMDCDDAEAAHAHARWLARHWTTVPTGQRAGIATQMAAFAAVIARDVGLAMAWRPLCEGGLLDLSPYRAWLDAELAFLRSDPDLPELIRKARALLSRVHDAGSARVLEDHLDRLQRASMPPPR